MKRAGYGFTIIELMIALSISAITLASAISVFNTRKTTTEFSSSMYDLQSKLQSYASQVGSKSLPGYGQYQCKMGPSNRPVLFDSSSTGQNCIYLGQAIQVIPGGDTIYAYPVFGFSTIHNGAIDTGEFPDSAAQATPEPAIYSADGSFLLVEQYPIVNGLKVVSASLVGNAAEHDLLTIYSSLQNSNTSGNQIDISAVQKTFSAGDVKSDSLKACVEGLACSPKSLNNGATWQICLTNDNGKQAQLRLRGTAVGITTSLNMDGCPAS